MTSYKIILIFSIITSCDARPLIDPRQYSENRKGDVIYCFVWGFIAAENSREPSWVHGTYPKIVILLLKRKYPNIKELIHMIDDSKVGACLLRNWGFPENIIKIIGHQYEPRFTHPINIDQEFKYEIAILYVSHSCYAIMVGEDNTETIFVDNFMELLGIQQKDCQAFYQNVILPVLLKNKKRLPEKISSLVHEQALEKYSARAGAF